MSYYCKEETSDIHQKAIPIRCPEQNGALQVVAYLNPPNPGNQCKRDGDSQIFSADQDNKVLPNDMQLPLNSVNIAPFH